ncbi:hypothetical protein WH47_12130 [Habropoda laboriosa]|uniref:Uncharacterized protein n=1 Tax=Habropoda laboriosa TaxID=597456 RepID=A0A0L7RAB7_9HYME|nr:PREDICTED: uncharacterized protein LOC108570094 [Habropoda laboriosa]KOC67800.1 hypothetical protein WH47_12130 [Habropoda laboriosa]
MMFIQMKVDLVSLLLLLTIGRIQGSENEQLREKRQALFPPPLVYPFGGTFKLIIGFAMPVQLSGRILVYGQNIQFQYMLPDNATFFTNFFENSSRGRRRRASWNERAPVYDILQQELDRRNIDGKGCLMKNICEAASMTLKNEGLMGELLHLLLTPDYGDFPTMDEEYLEAAKSGRRHENCSTIYSTCPPGLGILDRISTIY